MRVRAIITCHAKPAVMCMGGGCYKLTDFLTGGVTFDGEYIVDDMYGYAQTAYRAATTMPLNR